MEKYTYNFEISALVAQFLDAFNEITIKRYDRSSSHRNPIQKGADISPTFKYSSKQRIIEDYINNQAQIHLPVVAFHIQSLQRDPQRVRNKINGPEFPGNSQTNYNSIGQPVPVTLNIAMSIMSKSQEDVDQIITNFIPYCDDYVVISTDSPYIENQHIRTAVKWSGNVNFDIPTDLRYNDQYRIIADTNFELEGWLFKAENQNSGVIHNIYTYFHAVSDIYCSYDDNVAITSVVGTELELISGRPTITNAYPYKVTPCADDLITLNGSMFDFTSGFYISGQTLEDQEYFSFANTSLSSVISDLSGIEIVPTIYTGSLAQFSMPAVTSAGFFDIIAISEAGIGVLSQDSFNSTTIPAPSASPGEEGWEVYQSPCISGVEIISISAYC